MKIIHLSYSNFIGGASIAASRIHHALNKQNIDSKMWVNESYETNTESFNIKLENFLKKTRRFITWPLLKTLSTNIPIHHSISFLPSQWVNKINASDAHVVHLHWPHREMLSVSDIGKIKKPIVWTLHDMWAFCGAEHYTNNYRWKEGYKLNNRPNYETGFDLNRWTWERKKKHWKTPMQIVTPSKWLSKCVSESALMSSWPVSVIPNPIDINFWKPLDKISVRDQFNLPRNVPLLLFGAIGGSKDPRKGFDLLLRSLKYLQNDSRVKHLELVVFGEKNPKSPIISSFPIHYTGHINNKIRLRNLYNSVDAIAIPSRQDNLPNTALEALACAVPIIAFDIGGLTDIVQHQYTGYLAKYFKIEDFADGIAWTLSNNMKVKLNENARERAKGVFSDILIAKLYQQIYKKVISK